MTCSILVGGAWGDEGKGKCITYLCNKDKPNIIARAGVGPNAGHSVEFNGEKFRIIHIASFIQELSQFVIGKLMTSKDVTTIKGSTTEEALEQIKQLMNKQEREQKRVLSIFNESKALLTKVFL